MPICVLVSDHLIADRFLHLTHCHCDRLKPPIHSGIGSSRHFCPIYILDPGTTVSRCSGEKAYKSMIATRSVSELDASANSGSKTVSIRDATFCPTIVPVSGQVSDFAGLDYGFGLRFWVVFTKIVCLTLTLNINHNPNPYLTLTPLLTLN